MLVKLDTRSTRLFWAVREAIVLPDESRMRNRRLRMFIL